jgi:3,2-trans-enoyl-CoA isomerase
LAVGCWAKTARQRAHQFHSKMHFEKIVSFNAKNVKRLVSHFSTQNTQNALTSMHVTDQIAVLTLNNSPVNALTKEFLSEIANQVNAVDSHVRGLIIKSGLKNKAFSAGLDLPQLLIPSDQSPEDREEAFVDFFSKFVVAVRSLLQCNVPTVALIEGAAPAGGTVLALACDYRISTDNPKNIIGLTEHLLGLPPPRFVLEMGKEALGPRAKRYIQLGKVIGPEEALNAGFLDEIVDVDQDALKVAHDRLKAYLKLPSLNALHTTKMIQNENVLNMICDETLPSKELWAHVKTPEFQRVLQAYLDGLKRK